MRWILLTGVALMMIAPPTSAGANPADDLLLTDFDADSADLGWYVVNDNVMGGRSEGDFEVKSGELIFAGRTNTNGGGFSSIRTGPVDVDFANHAGIQLRVLGDGRRYTWRLATTSRWRGRPVSYWAEFDTGAGEWTTIQLPFSNFVPKFRGYELQGPGLDPANIKGMGLMIYDGRDGNFELHVASVHAYAAAPALTVAAYRWKKRVLVVNAPGAADAQLTKQQRELALYADEFAERDLLLMTLLDDTVSTAGDRELSPEEAALARETLGLEPGSFALRLIGKDGSVKMSRDEATPMTEIYALIDSMPMRQREMSGQATQRK